MLKRMQHILCSNDMCVLATTDGCKPHTSLMAYQYNADIRSVFMLTDTTTRKCANIRLCPQVSLLVDTRLQHLATPHEGSAALTVEGTASLLNGEEASHCMHEMLTKHPHLTPLATSVNSAILCVRVTSLQLLDGVYDMHVIKI